MTTSAKRKATAAAAAAFAMFAAPLAAQTSATWNDATATDNWWSTAANWNPATVPDGSAATALLDPVTTDRTVVYDGDADNNNNANATAPTGQLGTLAITQTAAAANTLEVRRSLALANPLALTATNGGNARLYLNAAGAADAGDRFAAIGSTPVLTAPGGITIGAGGRIDIAWHAPAAGGTLYAINGDITIDGGTLALQRQNKTSGSTAASVRITGDVTLASGTLQLNQTPATLTGYSTNSDTRTYINGNFTATGGTITIATSSYGNDLYLSGATNRITSDVKLQNTNSNSAIILSANTDQTLTGGATLNRLVISGSNNDGTEKVKLVGLNQVSTLAITGSNNSLRLKLDNDLRVTTTLTATNQTGTSNRQNYIDTNGHTLDASTAPFALTGSYDTTTGTGTTWRITGDGTLKIPAINLATGKATTIEGTTTIVATAPGAANNLTGGHHATTPGTISATSTFAYAAPANSAASTLETNRAIGHLRIDSGTLKLTGATGTADADADATDITATSVTIKAGATLDITDRAFTTPALTLGITDTAAASILTDASTFDTTGLTLTLDFDVTAATPPAPGTHALIGTGATTIVNLDTIVLSGLYAGNTLTAANAWKATIDGHDITFNPATGALSILTTSIPEPATAALILAVALATAATIHRKRPAV
jgi:hypothetical protein